MSAFPIPADQQAIRQYWQSEYVEHLRQRIGFSLHFLKMTARGEVRAHIQSFFSLLEEAQRYPILRKETLDLINALGPLPERWGYGESWKRQLRFALSFLQEREQKIDCRARLAKIEFALGNLDEAMREAQFVWAKDHGSRAAQAGRILFLIYRLKGEAGQADILFQEMEKVFDAGLDAHAVTADKRSGWLKVNQSRLELLREEGEVENALKLAEDMVWLNEQELDPDPLLAAELYTRRSTLLWVKANYPRAISDLKQAIELYENEDDLFNAKALYSDLGLVYWIMGDLDNAEKTLQITIDYFRRVGAQQWLTFDLGNMGLVYFSRGMLTEAKAWTEEHIRHAYSLGLLSEHYRGRTNLGGILYYLGKYQQALVEYHAGSAYFEKRGSREGFGLDQAWIACCKYKLGEKEEAIREVQEVVQWSEEIHSPVLEALSSRCLAHLLPLEERRPLLLHCLELVKTQGRILEQAAVYLALAQTLETEMQRQETWQMGVNILQAIGADAWLEGHTIDEPPFIPMFT